MISINRTNQSNQYDCFWNNLLMTICTKEQNSSKKIFLFIDLCVWFESQFVITCFVIYSYCYEKNSFNEYTIMLILYINVDNDYYFHLRHWNQLSVSIFFFWLHKNTIGLWKVSMTGYEFNQLSHDFLNPSSLEGGNSPFPHCSFLKITHKKR